MRALIVSGGKIDDDLVCSLIKNGGYDVIVAADSGMEALYRHHLTPDIIVGDFDSVTYEVLSFFKSSDSVEFVELNKEKDDTDTEHAVRDIISRGADKITIVGGTGTRVDHMLGNIEVLGIGLEEDVEMEMVDSCNRIRMINHDLVIPREEQYGTYVSVIPRPGTPCCVTLRGFKYDLTDYDMSQYCTLGISNEIIGEQGEICLDGGALLVIEARDVI